MKKLLLILLLSLLITTQTFAILKIKEDGLVHALGSNTCKNVQEKDIPTILIPGILASWYSAEGYGESNIKRWIC